MEYLVLLGIVVFLVVVIFVFGVAQEKRELKSYAKYLADKYGQKREYDYPSGRFEKIPMYFRNNPPKHSIDDITWNDLSMDDVFKSMNFTESSVGEEYLYYMLRNMDCDEVGQKKQEELITYFMDNEPERLYMQMLYHSIGKNGKHSIYDYLKYVDEVRVRSNVRQFLMLFLIAAAIVVCFFNSGIGVVALVSLLIVNIISYFKEKKEIEPYLYTLAYVQRLLDVSKKMCGIKMDILKDSQEKLRDTLKDFKDFYANSVWIHMGGGSSLSGNPLDIILDYLRMVSHIDLIIFNHLFKKLKGKKAQISTLVGVLGELEACVAIGWYRKTLPYYCLPDFSNKNLTIRNAYHPLLENAVPNSMQANGGVLITGSNASGKSTFLKTMAINAILAQGIHTVCAKEYMAEKFEIYSSMALRDNILDGDSYFMVEIKSIKRILEMAEASKRKMLCFVDEVLRGTNTVERIAASTHILLCLRKAGTLCFAATHDIELTRLLKDLYTNYHFEEQIEGDDVKFSYMLCEGEATGRNAIRLLRVLGYDKALIEDAENMAAHFLKTGKWAAFGKDVVSES